MALTRLKRSVKQSLLVSRTVVRTVAAYGHDCRRYLRFSSSRGPFSSRANLAAKITERYHNIEKGLSLPQPRPGFGSAVVSTLVELVERYLAEYGPDAITRAAIGALNAYQEFNVRSGLADGPEHARIGALTASQQHHPPGVSGVRDASRAELERAVSGVPSEFFTSRHSTRIYAADPVGDDDIAFAITAAQSAPAVCNRQFSRIRVWQEREQIDALLAVQGGARGFGDQVPALALVTVSLNSYWGPGERNQMWVDGGLFAMSFMYGLHARGLASVPLNWSKEPERDRALREVLPDLEAAESIVMFIGFGNPPERYRVAASPRIPMP